MLAFAELRRKKVQFGLVALVVALIAYLVLMVSGLGIGLQDLAGSALRSLDADAIAYPEDAGLSMPRAEISQELADAAANLEGVDESAPLGYMSATYRDSDGNVQSAAFLGFEPGTISEPKVVEGEPLGPDDRDALLADRSFLDAAGLEVGDEVEVSQRLEVHRLRIAGVIDAGQFFFQPTAYVLRPTWQEIRYGSSDPSDGAPLATVVLLKGNDLTGVREGLEIVSKDTAFENIEGVSAQNATVASLQAFGYIIGALVIGVFFYVFTLQKVPLIGMLKAVGASSSYVLGQLLLQMLTVTALGVAVAAPLAWLTERALSASEVPIAFTTQSYITTIVALLVTGLIGGLLSARQVLKTEPLIALGQQV